MTTVNPTNPAVVNMALIGSVLHFSFVIPRGADGGDSEVTTADLTTAINGTSSNSNGVSTLDTPFTNDPPTLADLEVMRAKMNELILALRR